MIEFTIINKETEQKRTIWGYFYEDACRREKINPDEWVLLMWEYID